MMAIRSLAVVLALVLSATGAAIERQTQCSGYAIINARGTGERQGESSGFRTMNRNILSMVPGGEVYNVVYSAGFMQDSSAATADIIRVIQTTLANNPNACFILEGYSQGAAGTTDALSQLTGPEFNAIKGVFLLGNPDHTAGLACNVDNNGGTTTRNVNGLSARMSNGIPPNWISKTLDVCILGDGVCDTTNGFGINMQHLQYSRDASTQRMGTNFGVSVLRGTA